LLSIIGGALDTDFLTDVLA